MDAQKQAQTNRDISDLTESELYQKNLNEISTLLDKKSIKNPVVIIDDIHEWISNATSMHQDILPISLLNFIRHLYDIVVNIHHGRLLIRANQGMLSSLNGNLSIPIAEHHRYIYFWIKNNSSEMIFLNSLPSGLSRSVDGEYTKRPGMIGAANAPPILNWQYHWISNPFSIKYWQKGSSQTFIMTPK